MVIVRRQPMLEIVRALEGGERCLEVLDPDRGRGKYAGEAVEVDGETYVHRPYRVWVDLAERLGLRLCTPCALGGPLVELRFEPLDRGARVVSGGEATERYGAGSAFARTSKLEDPGFVVDVVEALGRVALAAGARVLDLGCNSGELLGLVDELVPGCMLVGVDHSASALAVARERLPRATFEEADLAAPLGVGRFDLVVCVGVLQSGALDDRELVRRVVQDHLAEAGKVMFAWPNCRYVDGEVEYGARMRNFREPELGLVVKDIAFYRKYLQQHKKQVFVTGKNYLLVTGV